jgi:murein L,D-transpeptidase YcbB/YkuD
VAQLERARRQRLRPSPRRRWIRVNVPAFTLTVLDGDRPVLEMAVIVGRASRPTPLIEGAVSSVVLNPSWTVPPDLAHVDMLPKIRSDPGYLAARGIDVYESWAPGARRLDPRQVDWQGLGRGIEALALRQRSGPGNGLGQFLFGIADEYDVYLHDTPARALFDEEVRAFSSGCIRVANARALAREILGSDPAWSPARIDAAVATGDTLTIDVRDPMPIRVVYEPVWVDGAGELHVRDDVYDGPPRRVVAARPVPAPAVVPLAPPRRSPEPRRAERPTSSADAPGTAMLVPAWPAGPAMYWGAPPAVDQASGVVRRP